jgi:eukaryotic-like serine/threonine-protein kinase
MSSPDDRSTARTAEDLTGRTVGRYVITARLGAGNMGEVYLAQHTQLRHNVAIKRLAPRLRADERYLVRFLREGQRASALNHPHIARVYDVLEEKGELLLVMEYVEGTTLREHLKEPIRMDEFLETAIQCGEALAAAHQKGILHGDIKPENIMLTPERQVKVLDFGVARRLPIFDENAETQSLDETVSGTPAYMAPEVLLLRQGDARADIFSLGVVFYEALSGRHPFLTEGFTATTDRILHEDPPQLRKVNPDVPEMLSQVVAEAIAKDPAHRYPCAGDLVADLRRLALPRTTESILTFGRMRNGRRIAGLASVCALVLAAMLVLLNVGGWRDRLLGPGQQGIGSLAVLPLANLSNDPQQEYFADGMTDLLIADLSQIRALRVISRTSVMRYKGTRKPLPQIARELSVDGVIEGSVWRADNRVRITVQLIQGTTDKHLWAKSYDRDLRDVLKLQGEVASAIANEIQAAVMPQERERLTSAPPVIPAAYEAYLKGRYHLRRDTQQDLQKARQCFEQAAQIDPSYAQAYAGLADYYWADEEISPKSAMGKAKEYALKALEIDPNLAEAYTSLAAVRFYADWNWSDAERDFRRALDLDPGNVEAHRMYSAYLQAMGRAEEAVAEARRAQELDPLSIYTRVTIGWAFYYARRYDEAIEQCGKILELEPDSVGAHDCLGLGYLAKNQYEKAVAESRRAVSLSGDDLNKAVGLARAYALAGNKTEARKILDDWRARAKRTYISPSLFAQVYLALGEKRQGLAWLEKAYADRDVYLVRLKVEPAFDSVRADPGFQDLVRRVGFRP